MRKPKSKALTPSERKTIERMVAQGETDAVIAGMVDRSVDTIRRYRKRKLNIIKGAKGSTPDAPFINPSYADSTQINVDYKTYAEKCQKWEQVFKSSNRYKRLEKNLSPEDLTFFVETWAVYHVQLEEMTPSEEDTLEILINLSIRINANQSLYRECIDLQNSLRRSVGNKELDLSDPNDLMIFQNIESLNKRIADINKDLKDLTEKYQRLQESLNVTRKQREELGQVGAQNFLGLVKQMNDEEFRQTVGIYNERMKAATRNQTEKLKQPHNFMTGEVEPILLDGSDYMQEKKK